MQGALAEFIGTFSVVFFGAGAVVIDILTAPKGVGNSTFVSNGLGFGAPSRVGIGLAFWAADSRRKRRIIERSLSLLVNAYGRLVGMQQDRFSQSFRRRHPSGSSVILISPRSLCSPRFPGEMSKSNTPFGSASVEQALGTSTTPLCRPSMGTVPKMW